MNITHISDIDLKAKGGGMNTVIKTLIKQQINSIDYGSISLLLTTNQTSEKEGFKVYNLNSNYKELLINSDIVIFHSVYNLKFIKLYKFLKKNNIPYIIVSHGAFAKPTQDKGKIKKLLFKKLFLDAFVKNSLALSFLTPDEQRTSIYPQKNYIIVPNTIEATPNSHKPISFKRNNGDSLTRIVFMSKVDYHHKGLDLLLEVAAILKQYCKENKIVIDIYGYGKSKNIDINHISKSEKDILKLKSDIIRLDLTDIVSYRGPVFGKDKEKVIENSDIMILPSRLEGMPLTILEFLSYGIPVLITEQTNMGQLISDGNAGWVSTFDPKQLATNIKIAVSNYRKNPKIYKTNAFNTFKRLNGIDIGSLSIKKYQQLLSH